LIHASDHLPAESQEKESEQFEKVRKAFLQVNLIEQAQGTRAQDINHQGESKNLSIVNLTRDLIQLFQKPEMGTTQAYRRRIEFQLVYYMLEFLSKYHHRIVTTIEHPQVDYLLLEDQLKFMRSFLGRFRNIYQGEMSNPKNSKTLRKLTIKANSSSLDDRPFSRWIHEFILVIFDYSSWLAFRVTDRGQQRSAWMTAYEMRHFVDKS
jgi:hypothetical protein